MPSGTPAARPIRHEGEHYRVDGAQPGPAPAHDVEIWLGAYKPRMLALTGAKADGWLPSQGYVELGELPRHERRDRRGGRRRPGAGPDEIRRLFNVNGASAAAAGSSQGARASGPSSSPSSRCDRDERVHPGGLLGRRRPALRRGGRARGPRAGRATRRGAAREPAAPAAAAPARRPRRSPRAPTPDDGPRLSDEQPWDETTRPTGPAPDPDRRYTRDEQAAGRHLIDVHDACARELDQLRDLIEQVAPGRADAAAVRSFITRMTIRQNHWTLGTFCETYCRVVTQHHTLEDRSVFPHLRRSDPALAPVIDRLEEEHETIADLLERVDQALVALVAAEETASTASGARWTCSPTRCSRTSPTRSASSSSRSRGYGFY